MAKIGAFRFWCQKVLPLVYDDSISYYELLNKMVVYLNNVISDFNTVAENFDNLDDAFDTLQGSYNDTKNAMLSAYDQLQSYVNNYFDNLDVQEEINNKLDEMAEDGSLSELLEPFIESQISSDVAAWLQAHITPTSPAVDSSLTVSGAAADAKVVGDKIRELNSTIDRTTDEIGTSEKPMKILSYSIVDGAYNFRYGTINVASNYGHLMYDIQNERYFIITGYKFDSAYSLWGFLDENNNVLEYEQNYSDSGYYTNVIVYVPAKATKIVVNMRKNLTSEYPYIATYSDPIRSTMESIPSVNVYCDLIDIKGELTLGKAKNINGTENPYNNYFYKTFNVNGGETLYIRGWHFANNFPAMIVYDSSDNIIFREIRSSSEKVEMYITIPSSARKIDINGRATQEVGKYVFPEIKKYSNKVTLNDFYQQNKKRRYLVVGDSYCQGYSHDGTNSGWWTYCAEYMGLTSDDYIKTANGGAHFSGTQSENTFSKLLFETYYPHDYFTDIVVCGGYNDNSHTASEILAGIKLFANIARYKYPTAKIHVGFIAWNKAGNGSGAITAWETIHAKLINVVLPAYHRCVECGPDYMNNVEYWINDNLMTDSDGYHPGEAGNQSLARAIGNALLTGSAPLPYNEDLRLT